MMALSRLLPWFLRVSPAGDTSMTFLPRGRLGVALRAGWSGRLLLLLLALSTLMAQPVAAAATPKVYVGLFKDNAVAVLDTSTNRVQSIIPVPQGPHGLAITPDGRKVYVSSDGTSTVSVIDTQTDKVVGSIEVGANPHGLAMSADGRQVLVGGFGTNQVLLIDTTTDQVVARLPVPMPHNSALSPDGHMAYVGSQQQGAQSERRQATGPAPKPRWMPLSALLYAQVIKTVRRQPLPLPMPTNGTGSAKQWWPQTPAMAAGLTDRVWTLREVLMFRVPPWPQPQAV